MSARLRDALGVLELADHRLRPSMVHAFERLRDAPRLALPDDGHVVLVGQRAAGKSTLLHPIAALLNRSAWDLDVEIERSTEQPIRTLFSTDPTGFRRLERNVFNELPKGGVVAAGGGFLSHHADLLGGHIAVLVPVSEETYRGRLLNDPTRPRLRPDLSLDEELRVIFREREALHARVPTVSLVEFLARGLP